MDQFQLNIVIGCMVFLAMKRHAPGIGHVGMVQLQNNCVSVDYYTMKMLTAVIGPRMLKDAKSIVSILIILFNYYLLYSNKIFFVFSIIQLYVMRIPTVMSH